jgi:hypothetical protein
MTDATVLGSARGALEVVWRSERLLAKINKESTK